jgi:hypothetical protein
VALYTGTRASAVCGAALQPTEGRGFIDLARGVFYRRPAGRRETTKRAPPIPLPDRLLAHLRRWAPRRRADKMVRWCRFVRSSWQIDRASLTRPGAADLIGSKTATQLGSENRILPDAHFFQHLAKIGRMPEIGYERLQHCVLFDLNEVWRSNSSRLSTELSLKKE